MSFNDDLFLQLTWILVQRLEDGLVDRLIIHVLYGFSISKGANELY